MDYLIFESILAGIIFGGILALIVVQELRGLR